ncbi:PREDICTED: bromodomain-containing protein DDB_G0280777 [Drosophila arizonae]|uniref:Bromodomain-containing protein DDB_G0280777 n=1 Tax=Drosophila arizonae TaxID=7263 RepID=A0ABM1Q5H9_DROAR|nr:PREDICTED: bromodomain-containing protein DDB_G0280777 [Drosophila arizonae]
MKRFSFLVYLSCVALVVAAPQGYKYQQNTPLLPVGNLRPQTPISTSGIYSVSGQQSLSQPISPVINNVIQAPQPLSQPLPQQPQPQQQQQQQFVQNYQQQQVLNLPQPQIVSQPQQQLVQSQYVQRPSIVTKDIYIHSAPDDTEELQSSPQLDNTPIRKNYRIVFIKAPTQNLKHTAAVLKRAQASNEEKTVIYVLSKKPDINEIHQHLQLAQTEPKVHKPEVYFIKYKTSEEAQRAQQEIQAQYDALGGATHISDEGVAPITSFSGTGSLNLGNIVPQSIQQQHHQLHPPQTQTVVQNGQGILSQSIQQPNSFVPSIGGGNIGIQGGLQTSSVSTSTSFGVNVPSKRYIPAKTK